MLPQKDYIRNIQTKREREVAEAPHSNGTDFRLEWLEYMRFSLSSLVDYNVARKNA